MSAGSNAQLFKTQFNEKAHLVWAFSYLKNSSILRVENCASFYTMLTIEEHVPLGPLTTFKIGGLARFFTRATTIEELQEAITLSKEKKLKFLILGGGSNMLFDDRGFDGLIIKMELTGIEIQKTEKSAVLISGAGESWDALVLRAVQEGLWGIENLSGIPGTAGAAPVQNIGAYGPELKDTFLWAQVLNVETGTVQRFNTAQCAFGYRTSLFKVHPGRYVVLQVALGLLAEAHPQIIYRDLAEAFAKTPAPSLQEIREAILSIRARKFPNLLEEGTAGSFFLNPVVSAAKAQELLEQFPELPQYPTSKGVKISLAWLLDQGLGLRGFAQGNARLFEKQPLVVVATRTATSHDVIALKNSVKEKVFDAFGISLEEEVRIIT